MGFLFSPFCVNNTIYLPFPVFQNCYILPMETFCLYIRKDPFLEGIIQDCSYQFSTVLYKAKTSHILFAGICHIITFFLGIKHSDRHSIFSIWLGIRLHSFPGRTYKQILNSCTIQNPPEDPLSFYSSESICMIAVMILKVSVPDQRSKPVIRIWNLTCFLT